MRELLQKVLDAPDDDAPRLVYADWLQDQGDHEHAELIRVQLAAAVAPTDEALARRSAQLLVRCGERIAGRLAKVVYPGFDPSTGRPGNVRPHWEIRRGFVGKVTLPPLFRMSLGPKSLLSGHPLQELEVGVFRDRDAGPAAEEQREFMARLATEPLVEHIQQLGFSRLQDGCADSEEDDPLVRLLAGSWRSLRWLSVSCLASPELDRVEWPWSMYERVREAEEALIRADLARVCAARLQSLESLVLETWVVDDLRELETEALSGVEVRVETHPGWGLARYRHPMAPET